MKIRQLREARKLSREVLSKMVGISKETLARYERGDREPRASDIKKLCEVLKVSEVELLSGEGCVDGDLKIHITWDVDEYLGTLNAKNNEFNIGFRGDVFILWGAIPQSRTPEEVVEQIRRELIAAQAMRAARVATMGNIGKEK